MRPWEERHKRMPRRRIIIVKIRNGLPISKLNKTSIKNKINNEMELEDLEGKKEEPIKWWYYDNETLVVICSEMKEEFAKLIRKESMTFNLKYKRSYSNIISTWI